MAERLYPTGSAETAGRGQLPSPEILEQGAIGFRGNQRANPGSAGENGPVRRGGACSRIRGGRSPVTELSGRREGDLEGVVGIWDGSGGGKQPVISRSADQMSPPLRSFPI